MVARRAVLQTPTLSLQGRSFDEWMQSKSGNFRSQMRRMRRQLADDGGVVRMSDASSDLERDIDAFMRLHLGRWEERGGSGLAEVRMDRMLLDAAGLLLPEERFRLWLVEIDGKAIGAGLFLAAGGELSYFNGGFDEEFARYKPTLQAILSALEDAFGRGEKRLDFGGGPQPYKLRFADSEAPLAWVNLRPRTARYPLTWAQTLRGGPPLLGAQRVSQAARRAAGAAKAPAAALASEAPSALPWRPPRPSARPRPCSRSSRARSPCRPSARA